MKPHRVRVTHELVTAYDMLDKMHVLKQRRATAADMTAFHTDEYIHFLQRVTPETVDELTGHGSRFLVGEDNPAFEGVFEYCSISAGGSICAAERVASGSADIAINWAGGLHHAKKREASGFCYINDIVLGILELLRTHPRVLYIDIDVHHGDGVEEAFYTTDRVMTCSFHKFGEFFPGTGTQEDKGRDKGRNYSLNIPLKDGITDEAFKSLFDPIIAKIMDVYRPTAVVLQCGADSLAGDRLGCFNLTMEGHAHCVQFLRQFNIPLILLGGGGYTVKNVVRAWAYETACALGIEKDIDPNLPWNSYFEWFGPRYRLEVVSNNMDDLNVVDGLLDKVRTSALQQLQELPGAPSVGLQDVPRESLAEHLNFRYAQVERRDDLDIKLAQHARYVYDLQESDTPSDTSDDEGKSWDSDSDESRAGKNGKKPMSILTNGYLETPVGATTPIPIYDPQVQAYDQATTALPMTPHGYPYGYGGYSYGFAELDMHGAMYAQNMKRRFFHSGGPRWMETTVDDVVAKRYGVIPVPRSVGAVGRMMERGGRQVVDDDMEEDEW
ncbi:hypothetical protein H0H93_008537 [Arthromyces matolae]|nr:hypothetical protein H0H93_008537 [Arthromyces matolae]